MENELMARLAEEERQNILFIHAREQHNFNPCIPYAEILEMKDKLKNEITTRYQNLKVDAMITGLGVGLQLASKWCEKVSGGKKGFFSKGLNTLGKFSMGAGIVKGFYDGVQYIDRFARHQTLNTMKVENA